MVDNFLKTQNKKPNLRLTKCYFVIFMYIVELSINNNSGSLADSLIICVCYVGKKNYAKINLIEEKKEKWKIDEDWMR